MPAIAVFEKLQSITEEGMVDLKKKEEFLHHHMKFIIRGYLSLSNEIQAEEKSWNCCKDRRGRKKEW